MAGTAPGFVAATCPGCGARSSKIPAALAGKSVRCTRCGATFKVEPEKAAPARPAPAPTAYEEEPRHPRAPAPTDLEADGSLAPTLSPGAALAQRGEWRPGEVVLGLYEVKGILGQGGMGRVYKVRHLGWDVDLAVKVPLPAVLEAVGGADNFEREAETWVNLGLYPHTVVCYYVRRVDGVPRVFAELVEGGSLHDWISQGRLGALPQMLDVAIQFAWGLHYAHEQGLVHRDVKPANVMLTPDGIAKVTDFGLARARPAGPVAGSAGGTVMVAGGIGGTPAYLSPEQAAGLSLTRRSDLWSFALSVLEMFRGGRTWEYGVAAGEVLEEHLKEGPPRGVPPMPATVVDLLRRSFSEDPEDRPRTLWDAALALKSSYEEVTRKAYPRQEPKAFRETADGLSNRAVSLLDLGREAQADPLWNRALKAEPHHLESTYNRTLFLWSDGRLADDEALARMEEARRTHSRAARSGHLLGKLLLALGEHERAATCLQQAEAAGYLVGEGEKEALARLRPGEERAMTLKGLQAPGISVNVTPNGEHVVAAGGAKDVRVWDGFSGGLLKTLHAEGARLRALALTPDGRTLLWGGDDVPLEALDLTTGRSVRSFQRLTGFPIAVAAAPNGTIVTGGSDRAARLWDLDSGRCLRTLEGHREALTDVAVEAAGARAFSASLDGTVRAWDLASGATLGVFEGHKGRVLAVAFSEETGFLFSGGDDRTVRQWDLGTGRATRVILGHTAPVTAVAAVDGRLITASTDRTVRVWDADRGRLQALFKLDAPVHAVAPSGSGRRVWVASGLAIVALDLPDRQRLPGYAVARPVSATEVETRDASFLGRLEGARQSLRSGDWAGALAQAREARSVPGHERSDDALEVWDELLTRLPKRGLAGAWEVGVLEGHRDPVLTVAVGPGGGKALSGGMDGTLRLWDIHERVPIATWNAHGAAVAGVAFAPDGRHAISGGWDKLARLWDLTTGKTVRTYEAHEDYVSTVAVSPEGGRVLTGSWDQTLRLWDTTSGRMLGVLEGHAANVSSVAFGPDGRFAVSGGWDAGLRAWDLTSFETVCLLEGHEDNVSAVALSPDGRQVASGGVDTVVRVFDLKSRREVRSFTGHAAEVTSVTFTPDGRFVVSASRDKTVRLWDLRTGSCTRTLTLAAAVLQVVATPEGNNLVWSGADCTVRVWRLDWEPEPHALPAWDDKAKGYVETFVSLRLKPETRAPGRLPEAEVDALLQDLRHHGFGGVERATLLGKLQDLTAKPQVSTFWDEVRRSAPRAVPKATPKKEKVKIPWGFIAAGLAFIGAIALLAALNREPAVRLSPYISDSLGKQKGSLADLSHLGGACDAGLEAYLEQVRAEPSKPGGLACLTRFPPAVVLPAYFDRLNLDAADAEERQTARRYALSFLVSMGDPAVDQLCLALGDPRDHVRSLVVSSLALMGTPRSVECFKVTANASDATARLTAAGALNTVIAVGPIETMEAWDLVAKMAADADPAVRSKALAAYDIFFWERAIPAVEKLAQDSDPTVKAAAEGTLAHLKRVKLMDFGR